MKKSRWLILVSLIICFLAFFTACDSTPALVRPTGLKIDLETQLLTWNGVTGADRYRVRIGTETEDVAETEYNLETMSLPAGEYTVQVMAVSENKEMKSSDWSKGVTYIKDEYTGLKFKLVDKTYYEVEKIGKASGDIVIPATYRGKPVRSIAAKAFTGKAAVKTVVIGENVKKIGARAFSNCSALTSVQFPDGLEEIGEYAFQNCRKLSSVKIPDGVKTISDCAFSYCREMTELTLGTGVVSIGASAFADCEKLETLVIPDGVKTLGESAFSLCDSLKTVRLGAGMETIGLKAFYNCDRLTSVDFGGTVTIGQEAFSECSALESIEIPDSVKTISKSAFYSCENLSDVAIGNGVDSIEMYAFTDTKLFENVKTGDLVYADKWLISYSSPDPEQVNSVNVTIAGDTAGIAAAAFNNCLVINSIAIPDSVKHIGNYAFAYCKNLTQLSIGSGVETIGDNAFYSCDYLATVVFGSENARLKTIGKYAFQGCDNLSAIVLPASVESIGTYAFEATSLWTNAKQGVIYAGIGGAKWAVGYNGNGGSVAIDNDTVGIAQYAFWQSAITDLTIPASVKTIGSNAFQKCESLKSVSILAASSDAEARLTEIPDFAFFGCTALQTIEIPEGIAKIGKSAFYECSYLTYVKFPDSLKTIGEFAFYKSSMVQLGFGETSQLETIARKAFQGCAVLGYEEYGAIKLPDSLKTIGDYAFYNCASLAEIVFGSGLETIGNYAFSGCAALKTLTLPENVKSVGNYAFRSCTAITELNLNHGLKTISKGAFYKCSGLSNIVLPATVETLGDMAFAYCSKVTGFVIPANVTSVGRLALYGCRNLTFYCEAESQPSEWNGMWNVLFRPVFWGCTLSEDKSYVVAYESTAEGVFNPLALNGISAPTRAGMVLEYWSLSSDLSTNDYSAEDVYKAPAGVTLYAKWVEASEIEPEPEPDSNPEEGADASEA